MFVKYFLWVQPPFCQIGGDMVDSPSGAATLASANGDEWFQPSRFAGILALLIVIAFSDVIFGARTFFYRDFGIFGYPIAFHHRESFWNGEIPLWNPLNNCGLPFLAQWNTLVLYPLSLFYVLLPISWSLGVFCLLHLFLAGMGMYGLAHHWTGSRLAASVAGLAFAFNGLTLSCLKWPNNIAALAWMPFIVWLAECAWSNGGRKLVLAVLAGALQMLTGGPEIILFTWAFASILWLAHMAAEKPGRAVRTARFVTVAVLVAGLAAAQLLPFLDLLVHSQRDAAYSDASWSMPLWGLGNLLVPLFHCFPSHQGVFAQFGQYWISSYYAGIGVLALAGLAIYFFSRNAPRFGNVFANGLSPATRVWLLVLVVGLSLVLSFGEAGMVYKWLRQLIPPLQIVRFPVKFVVLVVFALPLLCAFGVLALQRTSPTLPGSESVALRKEPSDRRSFPPGESLRPHLMVGTILLMLIAAVLWLASKHPLPTDQWPSTLRSGLGRAIFLALTLFAAGALGRLAHAKSQIVLRFSLLLLIWLDAMTHAPQLNPTVERWVYEPGLTKAELKLHPEPKPGESRAMVSPFADFRLNHLALTNAVDDFLYSRMSLFANANLIDSLPKVDGFFSLYIREESQVRSLLYASTNSTLPQLAGFLGVSQLTAPGKMIDWTPQPGYLPFATGGQKPVFADGPATLREMSGPIFDPAHLVYLPLETQSQLSVSNAAQVKVTVAKFRAHQTDLEVEAAQPALVVLSQSYYHHWRAYVNGKSTPIFRANHFAQALEVPAGRSMVQLKYQDRVFRNGATLSVLTLLVCLWLWFRTGKRVYSVA
jgi:hypothetical protein